MGEFTHKRLTTTDDTRKLATEIVEKMARTGEHVLALSGDLGAGKTTFAKMAAQELGITETVVSPTFVIAKFYELPVAPDKPFPWERLVHIDAYRLETWSELEKLGFADIFKDSKVLVLIEWPEQVDDVDQSSWRVLSFEIEGDERVARHTLDY